MSTVLSSNLLALSFLTEKKKAKMENANPQNIFHIVKNRVHSKALGRRHTEESDTSLKNSEWNEKVM